MEYCHGILDETSATIWVFGDGFKVNYWIIFWPLTLTNFPETFQGLVDLFSENWVKRVYGKNTGFEFNKFWWSS